MCSGGLRWQGRQAQLHEILFFLGKGVDRQASRVFDACQGLARQRGGLGRHHEPHVQRLLAAVVVRHLGEGIDGSAHGVKTILGHSHGREDELAACAFDLEQRAEAREHTLGEQAVQAFDDLLFGPADVGGDGGERVVHQRKAAVQVVDQPSVFRGEHRRPPAWVREWHGAHGGQTAAHPSV